MVYGTYNYSIHGVYRPTYNWGDHIIKTMYKLGNGGEYIHNGETACINIDSLCLLVYISLYLHEFGAID